MAKSFPMKMSPISILFMILIILTIRVMLLQWSYNEVAPELWSGGKLSMKDAFALLVLVSILLPVGKMMYN